MAQVQYSVIFSKALNLLCFKILRTIVNWFYVGCGISPSNGGTQSTPLPSQFITCLVTSIICAFNDCGSIMEKIWHSKLPGLQEQHSKTQICLLHFQATVVQ